MHSIKHRMVAYFLFIIIITVGILELFLISGISRNYYKSLEDSLRQQLQTAAELYGRYFADATLEENIINNVDLFWKQATARVEIIDMDGRVLLNSHGAITGNAAPDISAALTGREAVWTGRLGKERVMAASRPLMSGDTQVGVLRFVASLEEVHAEIRAVAVRYLSFGGLVILLTAFVSILLANTITEPLKKVTRAAEEMAAGNFSAQSTYSSRDEIGRLSATLNYLASEIVKKEQLKNEFITSISHELRTPLTSIKGWAVTLKEYENQEFLQDGLNIIEAESDRLTRMVSELLDFSRFISGKITLAKEQVHLPTLLEQLRIQLAPRAQRQQLAFTVDAGDTGTIVSDANRLKQVFINLLDNAFKFTPPGGSVSLTAATAGDKIVFTVRDAGSGIPPEELPRVKEKFYKGKSSKSHSGIGLSLCDEIVRLMQGTMELQSTVGEGTVVTVTLPHKDVKTS